MTIDIINYTDEQFGVLTAARLKAIENAQIKKNKLLSNLNEELLKERGRLIDRGIFLSNLWQKRETELTEACNEAVARVREELKFYLKYTSNGGSKEESDAPYDLDYSLSEIERLEMIKTYYEFTYSDPARRFSVFRQDDVAKVYLGERYGPLYHYFEDLAEKS